MTYDPFEAYIRHGEPIQQEKAYLWKTAMGLQAVDGLTTSAYLEEVATQNIEGELTLEEVQRSLQQYYEVRHAHESDSHRTEEADKVAARIALILSEPAFTFAATEYLSIHRRLFEGLYDHAGQIWTYNITKKEWILDGDTVIYGTASELAATLEYDLSQERAFRYQGLSMLAIIRHLSEFVSRLWQIQIFAEGNTRTTVVFFIKYLRRLGFDVSNDSFAEHAWYFRNALVRANDTNLTKGVVETTAYLERFLENLLLSQSHELNNRDLHV